MFTPTYDDIRNADEYGFTANNTRLKSPTDFAIANYADIYTTASNTTIDRVNGGTGIYLLCSSGSRPSYACMVYNNGGVFDDGGVDDTNAGVCPALLFNL